MSWRNARESAALLSERLKKLERKPEAATRPSLSQPVFVKPSRTVAPSVEKADAITAELADIDLIELVAPAGQPMQDELAAEAEQPAEGRRAPRKSHTLPAYLTGAGMTNVIPGRVLDMSATGAKIELTPMGRASGIPMTDLPDRFILVLRHDKMEVDCETVWRKDWLIGVRFLGFPRPQQSGAASQKR